MPKPKPKPAAPRSLQRQDTLGASTPRSAPALASASAVAPPRALQRQNTLGSASAPAGGGGGCSTPRGSSQGAPYEGGGGSTPRGTYGSSQAAPHDPYGGGGGGGSTPRGTSQAAPYEPRTPRGGSSQAAPYEPAQAGGHHSQDQGQQRPAVAERSARAGRAAFANKGKPRAVVSGRCIDLH